MGWSSLYVVLLLNVVVIWLLIKIIQKSKADDWKISLSFVNTFILFRFLVACNNVASSLTHVGEVIKPTLITILKGYLNLYLLLALMFFTAKISVEMVQKIQKKGDKI